MRNIFLSQLSCALFCMVAIINCGGSSGGNSGGNTTSSDISRKYRTNDNGCDSGLHVIQGSSAEDVNRRYCEALQDQQLNKFCPTYSREDLFKKNCPGQVFTAKSPAPVQAASTAPKPGVNASANPVVTAPTTPAAPVLNAYLSDLTQKLQQANSLEEIADLLKIKHFEYHHRLIEKESREIADVLATKLNLVVASRNVGLQKSFLTFAETNFAHQKNFMIALCDGFMASPDEELRTEAAGLLVFADTSREDARKVLRQAFKSKNSGVRYNGVYYLAYSHGGSPNDELLVLSAIADTDSDVRNVANSAAEGYTIGSAHLALLKKLLTHSNQDVRYEAASLLGRMNDEGAVIALIDHMNDSDSDVRNIINTSLESKTLPLIALTHLETQLDGSNEDVRYEAASLIAHFSEVKASHILITHMADKNKDVRQIINSTLEGKTLTDANLASLSEKLQSSDSDVRYEAASLIGHINSAAAKATLKRRLAVEKNSDVINIIESILGL